MATTTNYGWTTPDDTALVKDGAAAIRSLGTSVDTTTKNLNPSTTLGDIEYRSSTANVNTRLPLGTAGQVLKVNSGATAPEWATDASGMTNPMTTTGDTIYSSSGSTPARLGIGSTGQVLTVAGGVPSWATATSGGMTLLSTTTLSGSSTSISSISQSHKHLLLIVSAVNCSANNQWYLRMNGAFGNIFSIYGENSGTAWTEDNGNDLYCIAGTAKSADGNNAFAIWIYNYASTTRYKPFSATGTYVTSASANKNHFRTGAWRDTTALSSIDINTGSGTFNSGTVLTYGVS